MASTPTVQNEALTEREIGRDGFRAPVVVEREPPLLRVYVWQIPVRLIHWLIFLSFIVLSFTGYYIHNPFLTEVDNPAFTMGWMRFIHEVTAFVFTLSVLSRFYWFFAGNRFARWRAFVPVSQCRLRGVGAMLRYYLFLRWRAPDEVGHNPLAGMTYLVVYLLFLVQIVSGFALYAWVVGVEPWTTLFGWIPGWISIRNLRLLHYFLMFAFFGFIIHHIYSALLVSAEKRNGTLGSIFSGYKFVSERELAEDEACDAGPAPSLRFWRRRPAAAEPAAVDTAAEGDD
ncbi:MAG TPA: Ni/Fe-hydrogenase, b-type cytochrome subunit [Thermomicrobiales bacterium]|nr:Ni/Fe-hydrogenase, b-type cytochrome subunit [Thermomicrobiales bacterium]